MAKQLLALLCLSLAALVQANLDYLEVSPPPVHEEEHSHEHEHSEEHEHVSTLAPDYSIVGSIQQADLGQFPWQAALFFDNKFCGGSLVAPNFVLTAAHCTYGARSVRVEVGVTNLASSSGRQTFRSRTFFTHPQYDPRTNDNDLAIVQLPTPAILNELVSTVVVDGYVDGNLDNKLASASAWIKRSRMSLRVEPNLAYVNVTVMPTEECVRALGRGMGSSKLCTTVSGSANSCNAASGGALAYYDEHEHWVQIGVSSFSRARPCTSGFPRTFTRVSDFTGFVSRFAPSTPHDH